MNIVINVLLCCNKRNYKAGYAPFAFKSLNLQGERKPTGNKFLLLEYSHGQDFD